MIADRLIQIKATELPDAIRQGTFDVILHKVPEAVEQRQQARREALLAQVKDVFGPDATITVAGDGKATPDPSFNRTGHGSDGEGQ